MDFDGVLPDKAEVSTLSPKQAQVVQSYIPWVLNISSLGLFLSLLLGAVQEQYINTVVVGILICSLIASLLRGIEPMLFTECGHFTFCRTTAKTVRLVPPLIRTNMMIGICVSNAIMMPLCLFLFPQLNAPNTPDTSLLLRLSRLPCIAQMLSFAAILVCSMWIFSTLLVGPHCPVYSTWMKRNGLATALVPGFIVPFLLFWSMVVLPCSERRWLHTPDTTCRSGAYRLHAVISFAVFYLVGYFMDICAARLRLLSDVDVVFYALEPRLDGLFIELWLFTTKVAAVLVTFLSPSLAYSIVGLFYAGLLLFLLRRYASTVAVLQWFIQCLTILSLMSCIVLLSLSLSGASPLVQGLVLLIAWAVVCGCLVGLHFYQFKWNIFGGDCDLAMDIILL